MTGFNDNLNHWEKPAFVYRVIKNKVMQQDLSHFTVEDLQARCRQRSPGSNAHEEYCFELFRRAIVEKDNACWTAIYTQYEGLVMHWFKEQVPEGRIGDVPVSQMLTYPFEKLWRFFEAPKLAAARSLGSLLDYLHSCTITCVHEQYRNIGWAVHIPQNQPFFRRLRCVFDTMLYAS